MQTITWISAFLTGLVHNAFTGRVTITLDFQKGGIRQARTSREEVIPE